MAYTTINKSSLHMNTKLYTGTGSTNAQTGVGFQPDLLWNKSRTTADNHLLYDSIRGITKTLSPDLNSVESTRDSTFLTSIDSDGFTVGSNGNINANGESFVMWNWKANGAGSANTDGSINSTVSANTTSGFSIVSYTGTGANATIGHGLGSVPKMIIVKDRDNASAWWVYHTSLGATKRIQLEDNSAASTNSTTWNDTEPTSSVFSVGTYDQVNGNGINYIAYCFAEKQGYSKFGSYVGNGNADGSFIYTGFKPAFVICKSSSHAESWGMFDSKRELFNDGATNVVYANSNVVENNSYGVDFLSNGFKHRNTNTNVNASGYNMIYMAFAEAPLVGSNNVPCTAR